MFLFFIISNVCWHLFLCICLTGQKRRLKWLKYEMIFLADVLKPDQSRLSASQKANCVSFYEVFIFRNFTRKIPQWYHLSLPQDIIIFCLKIWELTNFNFYLNLYTKYSDFCCFQRLKADLFSNNSSGGFFLYFIHWNQYLFYFISFYFHLINQNYLIN